MYIILSYQTIKAKGFKVVVNIGIKYDVVALVKQVRATGIVLT